MVAKYTELISNKLLALRQNLNIHLLLGVWTLISISSSLNTNIAEPANSNLN